MIIRFHIINLFFPYGAKDLVYVLNGEKVTFHRVGNYEDVENNVKQNFSNAITCSVDFPLKKDKDERVEFVSKLNRLLSFCRGNTINYSYYEIINSGKIFEKIEIDAITAPYCSLELIPRWYVKDTERFLNNGLKYYDELNEIFSINKISWEFPQTRNSSSFLSSRSLILTAVVEYILFNFNSKINNMGLFGEQDFHEVISPL